VQTLQKENQTQVQIRDKVSTDSGSVFVRHQKKSKHTKINWDSWNQRTVNSKKNCRPSRKGKRNNLSPIRTKQKILLFIGRVSHVIFS